MRKSARSVEDGNDGNGMRQTGWLGGANLVETICVFFWERLHICLILKILFYYLCGVIGNLSKSQFTDM